MTLALRLFALLPQAADACAVCMGGVNSDIFRGLAWGFVVLVGSTFSILAVMVGAVLRIEKSREAAEQAASGTR